MSKTPLVGRVEITVVDKTGRVIKSSRPNTVIVDASRVLLAQLIPSSLTSNNSVIPRSGRPDVEIPSTGPDSGNSIAYLIVGYTTGDSVPDGAAATNLDTEMVSDNTYIAKLQTLEVSSNSLTFGVAINVTSETSNRKYFEAALYTAGPDNTNIPDSPNMENMLMFAHQVHSLVSAPEGSTINYSWTIAIPE
jgi:hypothetical protein